MTDPAPVSSAFYPVSLDVTGRACLVVGGGRVAARKARTLLDCGALVTVIAPSLAPEMDSLTGRLHAVERRVAVRFGEIGAGDPAEQRRRELAVAPAAQRVQRPLEERTRVVAPAFALGDLRLLNQIFDRGHHRRSIHRVVGFRH